MNCPVCATTTLAPIESAGDPLTLGCPSCRGRWMAFTDHLHWVESTIGGPIRAPDPAASSFAAPSSPEPPHGPRLCPSCGRLLTRFRISLDLPFTLDRCANCAGVWFDAPEWPIIRSAGLLPGLHHLFNDAHQHKLDTEERRRQHEARCRAIVGDEAFERAQEFKQWLDEHPQRSALLAFLDDQEEPRPGPAKPAPRTPTKRS